MAAAAQSLRLCLRSSISYRPAPALRTLRPKAPQFRRALSTSIARREAEDQDADDGEFARLYNTPNDAIEDILRSDALPEKEKKQLTEAQDKWKGLADQERLAIQRSVHSARQEAAPLRQRVKPRANSFWNEDETDPDLMTDEIAEDEFEEDDILSMGHGKLEEHRELREYARIAIWEMPLLSSKFPEADSSF